MERAFIYGDSLLKATMPDTEMRYHFHLPEVMAQYPSDRLEVVNRAKMGATVTKGLSLVEHDVQRGIDARWALVAYGGNDSDFDWEAIAAAPEEEHLPHTVLPEFTEKLRRAVTALRSAGVQPVLMTLPPIDGQRYFSFISQRADGGSVLRWLGDVQYPGDKAVLLLSAGFIDKQRPKTVQNVVRRFCTLYRTPMQESFARTNCRAEIVVLQRL